MRLQNRYKKSGGPFGPPLSAFYASGQRRDLFGLADFFVAVDLDAGADDTEEALGVAEGVLRGFEAVDGRAVGVGA